jgi:hypothetical protein
MMVRPHSRGTYKRKRLGTRRWNVSRGAWRHIEEWIVLDTPGHSNGEVRVGFDRSGDSSDAPVFEGTTSKTEPSTR